MENYILLFTDTFFANLFITSNKELANDVMISFGYNKYYVVAITIIGAIFACYANYFSGIVLFNIYKYSTDQSLDDTYARWRSYSEKSGIEYFAICNVIPGLGNIIGVLFGFLKMNILKFTLFVLASRVVYYYLIFLW
jgi:membrane protein YqaA with SNARE-associated domain